MAKLEIVTKMPTLEKVSNWPNGRKNAVIPNMAKWKVSKLKNLKNIFPIKCNSLCTYINFSTLHQFL
jgi:hypothetical protein